MVAASCGSKFPWKQEAWVRTLEVGLGFSFWKLSSPRTISLRSYVFYLIPWWSPFSQASRLILSGCWSALFGWCFWYFTASDHVDLYPRAQWSIKSPNIPTWIFWGERDYEEKRVWRRVNFTFDGTVVLSWRSWRRLCFLTVWAVQLNWAHRGICF